MADTTSAPERRLGRTILGIFIFTQILVLGFLLIRIWPAVINTPDIVLTQPVSAEVADPSDADVGEAEEAPDDTGAAAGYQYGIALQVARILDRVCHLVSPLK